jgi:Arm DNA-binding domain
MKKLKVSLYLKGDKKNQNGETAIYGKIYLGNEYSTFSTSKYIQQERWSKTNGLSYFSAKSANFKISFW